MNVKFDGGRWQRMELTGVDVKRQRPYVVYVYGEYNGREFKVILDEAEEGPLYGVLNSAIRARMVDCDGE